MSKSYALKRQTRIAGGRRNSRSCRTMSSLASVDGKSLRIILGRRLIRNADVVTTASGRDKKTIQGRGRCRGPVIMVIDYSPSCHAPFFAGITRRCPRDPASYGCRFAEPSRITASHTATSFILPNKGISETIRCIYNNIYI